MQKIIVASTNPIKIRATQLGFKKMFKGMRFKVTGLNVSSDVTNQPMTDRETFKGAINRVRNVSRKSLADFWVGIEGGLEAKGTEMEAFAWVVITSKDGKAGKARTGTFFLPKRIIQLIQQGKELGIADDLVFNDTNSKQKMGTVGKLTGGVVDRTKYYTEAVILALIPFKNSKLY